MDDYLQVLQKLLAEQERATSENASEQTLRQLRERIEALRAQAAEAERAKSERRKAAAEAAARLRKAALPICPLCGGKLGVGCTKCPHCREELTWLVPCLHCWGPAPFDTSRAGTKANCPTCNEVFTVSKIAFPCKRGEERSFFKNLGDERSRQLYQQEAERLGKEVDRQAEEAESLRKFGPEVVCEGCNKLVSVKLTQHGVCENCLKQRKKNWINLAIAGLVLIVIGALWAIFRT